MTTPGTPGKPPTVTARSIANLTTEELVALLREVGDHPANRTQGGLMLLTRKASQQQELIAQRITALMKEKKRLAGAEPSIWADAGYSGRQTNRR